MGKPAVVLLSGGLDSATCLALAVNEGYTCHALSIDYNQRNHAELKAAQRVAHALSVEHHIMTCDMGLFSGSALTDESVSVPAACAPREQNPASSTAIPVTYVPARNTIFLSMALGLAEVLHSADIFIGVNAVDYSGYPDCRPAFIQAFTQLANLATKASVEDSDYTLKIHTPLIDLSKAEIIAAGHSIGLDYSLTVSCYAPSETGYACGHCESCYLRRQGFLAASVTDPTRYIPLAN